ncbi:16051_t:CDS:2, partial [Racocetra persica]
SLDDLLLEAVLQKSMKTMSVRPVIIRKSLNNCEVSEIHIKADTNINETRPIIDAKTKQDIAQQPVDNEILNVFLRKKVVLSRLPVLVNDSDALKNNSDKSLEFRASIINVQCTKKEGLNTNL